MKRIQLYIAIIGFLIIQIKGNAMGFNFSLDFGGPTNFYFASNQSVLNHDEKEQLILGLGFGSTTPFYTSYSITDYLSVAQSHQNNLILFGPISSLNKTEVSFFKQMDRIQCALNVGYGFGEMSEVVKYNALFVQPSIGLKTKHFELAYSFSVNSIFHNKQDVDDYYQSIRSLRKDDLGKTPHYFFDHGFTVGFKYKNLKLSGQYINVSQIDMSNLDFEDMGVSVSLSYTIKLFQNSDNEVSK